jgi:hypothetical protein
MTPQQDKLFRSVLQLCGKKVPTEQNLKELLLGVNRMAELSGDEPLSEEALEEILLELHRTRAIKLGVASVLDAPDWVRWLELKRESIERYSAYLQFDIKPRPLSLEVINRIDEITEELLDRLGDPETLGRYKRRGLILGSVQSGKTATYVGLVCKAADAGYKCIIILSGTLELLRKQTQQRLDEGFIGLDSAALLQRKATVRVGVGENDTINPIPFTSQIADFSSTLPTELRGINAPALFVVKKNKKRLHDLRVWLENLNSRYGEINLPLLLIDDETDNASVNTKTNISPTEINKEIRAILALFTKSSYVGVTATPFANYRPRRVIVFNNRADIQRR